LKTRNPRKLHVHFVSAASGGTNVVFYTNEDGRMCFSYFVFRAFTFCFCGHRDCSVQIRRRKISARMYQIQIISITTDPRGPLSNRIRTEKDRCQDCECGSVQTIRHIIEICLKTRFEKLKRKDYARPRRATSSGRMGCGCVCDR